MVIHYWGIQCIWYMKFVHITCNKSEQRSGLNQSEARKNKLLNGLLNISRAFHYRNILASNWILLIVFHSQPVSLPWLCFPALASSSNWLIVVLFATSMSCLVLFLWLSFCRDIAYQTSLIYNCFYKIMWNASSSLQMKSLAFRCNS